MLLPVCLQGIMNVQVGMQRWCQYADKVQVGIQFQCQYADKECGTYKQEYNDSVSMLTINVECAGCNTASLPYPCSSIPDQINK